MKSFWAFTWRAFHNLAGYFSSQSSTFFMRQRVP